MDKGAILDRLREFLGLSSDAQLAEALGISASTLSNWRRRNTLDYDNVFANCEDADLNWLLRGVKTDASEPSDLKVKILTERLNYLNRILEEKERTIQILMNKQP